MPLLKKKPFSLLEPPNDLDPHELVYQVRFTKEIFRDYQEYLNRINLYRQRIWACKITGKANLTYEEALVSENHAANKVQEIPQELVDPALHVIQFSMLSLKDLADTLAAKLQEHLYVGAELHGRKGDDLCPCKILGVLKESALTTQYEIAWLDKNKKTTETAVVNGDDLIWKKFPLSRRILKSFIRKATYRSIPWVLHEKLAQKHCISNDPPENLKGKVFIQNGLVCNRKGTNGDSKRSARELEACGKNKKRKVQGEANGEMIDNKEDKEEPIKYPIEDLLVQYSADDPVLSQRPLPSRDFNVPMDSVGELCMVWDFCSSFSKLLLLWPFSLEDFEKSICHKSSNLSLIVETHSALLKFLMKDNSDYSLVLHKRNRKLKITLINWTEYLCDFIEMTNISDLSTHLTTIRRGNYGFLDAQAKLGILQELVNQALETDVMRNKLDDYVEQRQALGASRREEALAEGRRKREEKGQLREQLKDESIANGVTNGHETDVIVESSHRSPNGDFANQDVEIAETTKEVVILSQQNHTMDKSSERNHSGAASMELANGQKKDVEGQAKNRKDFRKKVLNLLKDENKEPIENRSKKQRREYFEREIEKRVLRTDSLGKDRYFNRYWWFRRDGRIFVESSDAKLWGYYSSKEELDLLMGSLNQKGERERALCKQLEKFYDRICLELRKRSKDLDEKNSLEEAELRRSSRVRALPRESSATAFLRYVNRWKED